MSLTALDIKRHYMTPEVMKTIIRVSTDGLNSRAGAKLTPKAFKDKKTGELIDWFDWYKGKVKKAQRKTLQKINLADEFDYKDAVCSLRTLYWTLNLFEKNIYDVDYHKINKPESPLISRKNTAGYTLGVDIDKEDGKDIHDPEVKEAVEAMAQFFSDKLREYAPNSVYCLYSGGGIYVMVHHKVFKPYFKKLRAEKDWDILLLTLLASFDALIGDIRDEFFKIHPKYIGKAKPDQLNGSQRAFKTIFSVHKSLDYAVIPLDPENIKIDFQKAQIPLTEEVLKSGDSWYTSFDKDSKFLNNVMKPYLKKIYAEKSKKTSFVSGVTEKSHNPISDMTKWAPCMRNLYNLPTCGEGRTRALAIFVSYLFQIGIKEEEAKCLFSELVNRWSARASNIFESYFGNMKVPTCERLTSKDQQGFPKGVSIKYLGVCKPDLKCLHIPSPRYYTDEEANMKRLLNRLSSKPQSLSNEQPEAGNLTTA